MTSSIRETTKKRNDVPFYSSLFLAEFDDFALELFLALFLALLRALFLALLLLEFLERAELLFLFIINLPLLLWHGI